MARLLARIVVLSLSLALAGCGLVESGDVKVVETQQQSIEGGSPIILLRLEVDTFFSGLWERVALVRDRKLVGLTSLARATRIACASPQSCRVHVLPPGAIWPTSYEIEPRRFFIAEGEYSDLNEVGRGLSVPIGVDSKLGGRAGLKASGFDPLGEAALVASFGARQFTREWPLGPVALIVTLFSFLCCWCVGALLRRFLPQSAPVAWLKRWPFGRTIPLLGYACAIAICGVLIVKAFADGPGAVMKTRPGILGGTTYLLEGSSPLEPLFSLIAVVAGIAVFDVLARALRAAKAVRAEAQVEADANA